MTVHDRSKVVLYTDRHIVQLVYRKRAASEKGAHLTMHTQATVRHTASTDLS